MHLEQLQRQLIDSVINFSQPDQEKIREAMLLCIDAHKDQTRMNGEPYAVHPIGVAMLLVQWGTDAQTVIAGLLHDTLEDTNVSYADVRSQFGEEVADLVQGVTKFTQADFEGQEAFDRKIETLRKLFEVMRSDVRVVIVKLADRLHNTRSMTDLPEPRRSAFAKETMDVYYKMCVHLGMNGVRRELSENCMPFLFPQECERVKKERAEMMSHHESVIREMEATIRKHDVKKTLIDMKVKPRSYYAMYKLHKEEKEDEPPFLYVVTAQDIDGCYELLKLFHTLYRPISGRFRDYIAVPTESAYQSIRTAVMGPGNTLIPIRIRTAEMNEQERSGILLKLFADEKSVPGFHWFKRIDQADAHNKESSEAFWQALQSDIFQEDIKVSVNGNDRSLPKGSTILDAMYAEYGEEAARVGHVMINGIEKPLAHTLEQDDLISAKLTSHSHISFEWTGYVATNFARSMITKTLGKRSKEEKFLVGQRLLQKEFDRYHKGLIGELSRQQRDAVARHYERDDFDHVITMVGEGLLRARDVLFLLFPEYDRSFFFFRRKKKESYSFHIRVTGMEGARRSNLPHLLTLARAQNVVISSTKTNRDNRRGTYVSDLRGNAPDRLHYADMIASIERQEHVSSVDTLASAPEKLIIGSSLLLAMFIIIADIQLLIPALYSVEMPEVLRQVASLMPIIIANHFILRVLEHYIVAIRSDKYYIGLGFLMNLIGVVMVIHNSGASSVSVGLLPLVTVFIFSTLYLAYRFFQTETLFSEFHHERKPMSQESWLTLKKRKIAGYMFRLGGVIIWGIQPLWLKYTPANDVDPLIRVFLMSAGILFISFVLALIKMQWTKNVSRKTIDFLIPKTKELYGIIVGAALFHFFLNASLKLTTSTNFALFNNFSPVLALIVAFVFWRQDSAYMKQPKHVLWISLIFILGSIGSSMVIFSSITSPSSGSLSGDMLGLLAMGADTLYVICQIRYMKKMSNASGLSINIHVFGILLLLMAPVMIALTLRQSPIILSLSAAPIVFTLLAGILSGIGQALNYETFRRIDGFIAFLMFNVSILITFIAEVFILKAFKPTWAFLLGGIIIISSAIIAEFINSKCQKEGY